MTTTTERKHWHLVTTDSTGKDERGGRISLRKYADHLAKGLRQKSPTPIYVVTCTEACGPAGRPLIEVLKDDDA